MQEDNIQIEEATQINQELSSKERILDVGALNTTFYDLSPINSTNEK